MPIIASEGLAWGTLLSDKITHENIDIFNGIVVFLVILAFSLLYRFSLKAVADDIVPDGRVSVKNVFQVAVESLLNLVKGVIPHHGEDYFPLIGAIFIYIFISNMLGLFPGFGPPSKNLSANLAVGLSVFVYYNVMGIKRTGLKAYIAHFLGPVWWMAPMLLVIELISHAIRPLSLSLRLFGNINGDHLVLEVFSGLVPVIVPVIFLAFGIFVSFIQAYVFTLLSTIYVSLAVTSHDHH
jgi:F-type H+-transporting ATPase subunit a